MKYILMVFFILVGQVGFAVGPCQVREETDAFFDGSKSAWIKTEKLQLLACDKNTFKLQLVGTSAKKVIDSVALKSPITGESWFFDGLTCHEPGEKPKLLFRNKVVLGAGLKIHEAWAPNFKSKKFEKVDAAKLICYEDEP